MWGGRFERGPAAIMEEINASVEFDKRLAEQDLAGSRAHAAMLARQGIISPEDGEAIVTGLDQIAAEIREGRFQFSRALEDIHLNIESRLSEIIGPAAGRLHTARSRNDQVATDFRLWVREACGRAEAGLTALQRALLAQAEKHAETIMPGFTHLQPAQPVSFGHHCLAYVEMFARDRDRFAAAAARMNECPLGAAALAGTPFPIDRAETAKTLGFARPMRNSLDAVASRDFALDYLAAASIAAVHLSRLAEEIVIWATPSFGFVKLSDAFSTGSSIMPQKKNPDVPELARGKTGRVYGHLMALLTLMKGQPLAYNKDNQEDKEPLFDSADTLVDTLRIFAELVPGIAVRPAAMLAALGQGHATATDLADYLVKKGLPFRDAHEAVARAVRTAETKGCALAELPLAELATYSPLIGSDVFSVLTVEGSLAARNHIGGTAPEQVRAAIVRARARL